MDSKFVFYRGGSIPLYGKPVVIVAISTPNRGLFFIERYIFIEYKKVFLSNVNHITYDSDDIPPEIINPEKWLNYEVKNAMAQLEDYFYKNETSIFNRVFLSRTSYELIVEKEDPLIRFHLLSLFQKDLATIRASSHCEALRSHLIQYDRYPRFRIDVEKFEGKTEV